MQDIRVGLNTVRMDGPAIKADAGILDMSEGEVGEKISGRLPEMKESHGGMVGGVGSMGPTGGIPAIGQITIAEEHHNFMQNKALPTDFWRQAFISRAQSTSALAINNAHGNQSAFTGRQQNFDNSTTVSPMSSAEMLQRLEGEIAQPEDFTGFVSQQINSRMQDVLKNLIKPLHQDNADKKTGLRISPTGEVELGSAKKAAGDNKPKKSALQFMSDLTQLLLIQEQGMAHAQKLYEHMGIVNQIKPLGLVHEFYNPQDGNALPANPQEEQS